MSEVEDFLSQMLPRYIGAVDAIDPAPGGSPATDALKDAIKVGPTTHPRSQP